MTALGEPVTGTCTHCRQVGPVWRYRVWTLGLRFMGRDCADRLAAMGMVVEPVTVEDQRVDDRGAAARQRPGRGIRSGLRWLRATA